MASVSRRRAWRRSSSFDFTIAATSLTFEASFRTALKESAAAANATRAACLVAAFDLASSRLFALGTLPLSPPVLSTGKYIENETLLRGEGGDAGGVESHFRGVGGLVARPSLEELTNLTSKDGPLTIVPIL